MKSDAPSPHRLELDSEMIAQVTTGISRRSALRSAAMLATSTFLSGAMPRAFASKSATKEQPKPVGPITEAAVTVTKATGAEIGPRFAGFSLEKRFLASRFLSEANHNAVALYKRLGPSILRLGGDMVDKTIWVPNGPGGIPGQIAPSDIDAVAGFCAATGWKCLYGVNLGGVSTGATNPALAASEVAYAARRFGDSLYGIEIGNEPDSYGQGGHAFANKGWSLEKYLTLWNEFRDAIIAATPNVLITGPAAAKNVSTWTIPFGRAVTKNKLGLLTQHFYRANRKSPDATIENLVTPDPRLKSLLAELKAGADSIGIPYRMAEVNSYAGGGAPGVSNSYASALWAIDFLFNCAQGGSTGADFHGGGDGPRYQPLTDANNEVTEVRPEYYGIFMFSLVGQGALLDTAIAAGSLNVTAYAVQSPTGLNLVVVNKDATQNMHISAKLPHAIKSASLLHMTQTSSPDKGPDLAATSGVVIQNSAIHLDGGFSPKPAYELVPNGDEITFHVPALSAVLVRTV